MYAYISLCPYIASHNRFFVRVLIVQEPGLHSSAVLLESGLRPVA